MGRKRKGGKRKGRKRCVRRLSESVGSGMGKEQPKATKTQSNNKTQTQPTAVTLHPTFSHSDFHNKTIHAAFEVPLGHSQRYTEQASVKETQNIKHSET